MSGTYELWLTSDTGLRLAQLDIALGLTASRADDKIAWFSLNVPNSFNINLIKPDNMLQVWRAPLGGRLGLWQTYFLRKWTFANSNGKESILLEGPDVKDLLRRRIVAAYSGSAQATKTDFADDMMKEVVTQSIADGVAPVPTAGTRVWSNLSIAADVGLGPTITKSFPFDQVLTASGQGVLSVLQKAAREAGTEVWFDIVPNVVSSNSISFMFQTYINQPGQDVSDRVVFDILQGNLKNPQLVYDYSEEQNYIYAAGQGEGASRNIQQVYDSARYDQSIWGRIEGFADARNQTSNNGIREAGRAALEEGRPKINFTCELIDTEGTRFGRDWDYGYKVKTKYKNVEFSSIARAVTISIDAKGERISAKAEYES
jgi:hypothetical protein